MSISIEKNKSPHLVKTQMNCDGGLAEKLDKFELLKHKDAIQFTICNSYFVFYGL